MQRRQEEGRHQLVVGELERLSTDMGDRWSLAPDFKEKYLQWRRRTGAGAARAWIDTMRAAYQSMRDIWHSRNDVSDLRVAAYAGI